MKGLTPLPEVNSVTNAAAIPTPIAANGTGIAPIKSLLRSVSLLGKY